MLAALGVIAGCSGDDTIVGGGDAGGDATTTDGTTPTADGTTGADTGTADTGTVVDSGNNVDSGDAGIDAPARTVDEYTGAVADAVCTTLERCCQALDAGGTDPTKCKNSVLFYGFQGSSIGVQDLIANDAGLNNVSVDAVQAQFCLNRINALPCGVSSALLKAAIQNCYGAVVGKVATNGACTFAPECAQPAYCQYAVPDAGSGTCKPLVATNGSCAAVSANVADPTGAGQEACSSRGSGFPAAYCDNLDDSLTPKPTNQWTCKAGIATDGGTCGYNNKCANDICDYTVSICGDTLPVTTVSSCLNTH
jgi:hypothetical protein